MTKEACLLAVAAVALLGQGGAGSVRAEVTAAELKASHLEIVECRTHNPAQEQADMDLAEKALKLMQAHDLAALGQLMPDLGMALGHAPDVPSQPEHCGDKIILYSDDMTKLLLLNGALGGPAGMGAKSVEQREGLPYGLLAFASGWTRYEQKDYAGALQDYEKGLRNSPDLTALESEHVLTLSMLGRNDEALSAVDAFIAAHPGLPAGDHAKMLRKRGYILVELKRWDEADAAYKQSLDLEPGNDLAKSEREYIAKSRPSKP